MNLFVYGTLLVPGIWDKVSGEPSLRFEPALLHGYEIRRVRNAVYPGIFESDDAPPVAGKVFFDLPETALRRLDAYEDSFYVRSGVHPELRRGVRVAADAFIVPAREASLYLSEEGWSLDWFESNGLEGFWTRVFGQS